tara:strand:- start:1769 stop:2137 length:369 start_codon:yes stop_codon:yes gene_type:complete
MDTLLYILWLVIWIPLSLLIVIVIIQEIIESVKDKKYSGLGMIIPLIIVILISFSGIKNPLGLFEIILEIIITIVAIGLIVGAGYVLLQLVRGIIKFVIKEVKKMSDEVDVEIKESKEKKGE